jgi:hypothetical protein
MNILVLHNVEDLGRGRRSTLDYIFSFERYQPGHIYHYQKITDPPPAEVKSAQWDAVIFESTSLGIVTIRPRELFKRFRDRWDFLKDDRIVKIAFPQDDANCGGLMDDWFSDWGVHVVYSVRAPEHWPVLYPRSVTTAHFLPCLSGYIDDNSLPEIKAHAKPWSKRQRLIGQRVTMYPPRGGRQGRLKGIIAESVKAAALARGLTADISTDPSDTFFGGAWYDFLGDCKFALGTEGGLSLNDPYGEIADRIAEFVAVNPGASFEEVEAACFPELDGLYVFSGFSPRVLEAAVCQSSQVLVEGKYLGVLEPGAHYLCLQQDLSNLDAVLDGLADENAAQARISACNDTLVESPRFRFSALAAEVLGAIDARVPAGRGAKSFDAFAARRGYVSALAVEARAEGFRWPQLGDRVAAQVARQQWPDDLRKGASAQAAIAAKVQVLASEIAAMRASAAEGSPACILLSTLGDVATSLDSTLAASASEPIPESFETTIQAIATAFDRLQFDPPQGEPPASLAPLLSMLGMGRVSHLLEGLSDLEPEGEIARFIAATSADRDALLGLASRLAPKNGAKFDAAEVERLRALDELVVRIEATGFGAIFTRIARGEKAEWFIESFGVEGDLSRLFLALIASQGETDAIVERFAPKSGESYGPEEIEAMRRLNAFLSGRYGVAANRLMALFDRNWFPLK